MSKIELEIENLLTFTNAASILGISRQTLYQYIKREKLHPIAIGGRRFLLRSEVESLKGTDGPG